MGVVVRRVWPSLEVAVTWPLPGAMAMVIIWVFPSIERGICGCVLYWTWVYQPDFAGGELQGHAQGQ